MGQRPLLWHWFLIQPDTNRSCKTMDTGAVCHIVACLLPSFRRYQFILFGDRGTWVWITCLELVPGSMIVVHLLQNWNCSLSKGIFYDHDLLDWVRVTAKLPMYYSAKCCMSCNVFLCRRHWSLPADCPAAVHTHSAVSDCFPAVWHLCRTKC